MRIVALINQNNRGGAQYALLRLKDQLAHYGHAVELVFLQGVEGGLEPEDGRILVARNERTRGPARLVALRRFARLLERRQPDAVIAFLPLSCVAGLALAWLAGVKLRIASQRNPGWSYGWFMRWLDLLAGSIGVYRVNIGNSKATIASFARYPASYRRRLKLVYNAIESDFASEADAGPQIALPPDVPLIMNSARLSPQKNQGVLIRAMPKIADAHLLLVGHGEAEEKLKAEAAALGVAERVHFLGNVSRQQIAGLLRRCTIFAQPSLFEGQSNALLEAMAMGCAIVSSDIPTQVETLTLEGGTLAGLVLPASSVEGWAEAINRLVSNPDLRTHLGGLARQRVADFSPERMAEGFAAALRV